MYTLLVGASIPKLTTDSQTKAAFAIIHSLHSYDSSYFVPVTADIISPYKFPTGPHPDTVANGSALDAMNETIRVFL